jgi:hypothetical protein
MYELSSISDHVLANTKWNMNDLKDVGNFMILMNDTSSQEWVSNHVSYFISKENGKRKSLFGEWQDLYI